MVKFIIGIVVGVCIVQFNILPMISDAFVSTGARDMVVFKLKEIKKLTPNNKQPYRWLH